MILTVGSSGYLLSNILSTIREETVDLKDYRGQHIDKIFYFGTPIDDSKQNVDRLLDFTAFDKCIKIAKKQNATFVYASSLAVEKDFSLYSNIKKQHELKIINEVFKYRIYRIPRVYSRSRNAGLIKALRDNIVPENDMHNKVQYITLLEFLNWFTQCELFGNYGIMRYNREFNEGSLQQIKNQFA